MENSHTQDNEPDDEPVIELRVNQIPLSVIFVAMSFSCLACGCVAALIQLGPDPITSPALSVVLVLGLTGAVCVPYGYLKRGWRGSLVFTLWAFLVYGAPAGIVLSFMFSIP